MPSVPARNGRDGRRELYPEPLRPIVNDSFVTSFDLFVDYVARHALAVFRSTGLAEACQYEVSLPEAIAGAGLDPLIAKVPAAWILDTVAQHGWATRHVSSGGEVRYRTGSLPELEPKDVRAAQEHHDPDCLPSYDIVALAASQYPAVLQGKISGEQALFGPDGILPWMQYFSNGNPIYAISNRIGAIAAIDMLPAGKADILEIGAGLGSGADALLQRLRDRGREEDLASYRVTDVSPLFLKRAQRALRALHPRALVSYSSLDINRPFEEQSIDQGRYTLVYGVNVLHVARDLEATLWAIHRCLKPGGAMVMAECVRPFDGTAFALELVFNLLESFRDAKLVLPWRPNGGFLTPGQWQTALSSNGFTEVRVYPDIDTIRDAYPNFVSAALLARKA